MLRMVPLKTTLGAFLAIQLLGAVPAVASSHMDAPLISLDDPANTTDVYAFKSKTEGVNYLTTALSVYPFEEPGVGPNNYGFDPTVVYDIHVALGQQSINAGRADITYRFDFRTIYSNPNTILQSYLGVVTPSRPFHANENRRQNYTVTKIDHRAADLETVLGRGRAPPNNQGRVTPAYNMDNDGDKPAMGGSSSPSGLDAHTKTRIFNLQSGYMVFAGQRDDAFYGDIQSIFDLDFSFDKPEPFDSQGGFNVHTIVLNIPTDELAQSPIVGVYATTSRRGPGRTLRQVGRQGNPLFVEALVAIKDKDEYNRSSPTNDERFRPYAAQPELSALLGVTPIIPGLLESIFIPDLIKVDMTTDPARLSAGDSGFSRLSVFGNDVLKSTYQDPFNNGGFIPGGWPNGRRFGDDVVDIAVIALGAAGNGPDFSNVNVDKVTDNDITYNRVFPYAATPHNGRNHPHH